MEQPQMTNEQSASAAPLGSKPSWEQLNQPMANMNLRAAQVASRSSLTRSFPNVATFNPNGQNAFPPTSSYTNAPFPTTSPYADIRGDGPRFSNSGSLNNSPAIHAPRSSISTSHGSGTLLPPGAIGAPSPHPLTSSTSGLRTSNTGIMTGSSLRASGVHPIPVAVEPTVPLELGVICLLKDNYGFVRCTDREEDIFFHCTSLIPPQPLSSEELYAFITSIRVGNEVSFHVVNDNRTGKLSAVNLSLLPKGSVVFTDTIQEKVRGIILREVSEHSDENDFGVVAYRTTEDTVEQLRFSALDLDEPRVPLAPEDEVEFDIVYNRRLKGKCAAHVVLMRFGGDRQTGIIHSVKDGFGFIRCCDSPRSLYFHFRDVVLLQRGQEISKGVEVEYTVANDERAGKLCAVRVRGLPKGTVSFTVTHDERQRGVVQRELSPALPTPLGASPFTRREDEEKGVITFTTYEGTDSLLFGVSDIRNFQTLNKPFPYLRYGDEVECTVLTDKRNGRKHATDVILVTPAMEKVEMGVICSVKKNYGHITCAEQDEDLFFHFTDFEDSNVLESITTGEKDIHAGMEVRFVIVPDSRTGKRKAAHIHLLDAGTVKFEDVSESRLQGLVVRECKPGQTGYTGKRQPSDLGVVEYQSSDKSGNKRNETVTFGCNDVKDTKISLWPGDVVSFNVATDKRTKSRSAVGVELVTPTNLPREVGVVSSVKNSFGFIKCSDRDEEVYFHFSELDNADSVTPGTELEFSVVKNSWFKKLLAIRIRTVGKNNNNKFSQSKPAELRHFGVIDREPRGRGVGGKISYKTEDRDDAPFSLVDFSGEEVDTRFNLKKGDRVQFTLVEDPRTKMVRASGVVPATEFGVVATTKENFGFIRLQSSSDEIFFHQSEVGGNVNLTPGDQVEFQTVLNPRTKTLSAQGIRKSGSGISVSSPSVQPFRSNLNNSPLGGSLINMPVNNSGSNLRGSSGGLRSSSEAFTPKNRIKVSRGAGGSPDAFVLRQPTSSDGGKGFHQGAGRGKLNNKDREVLVQQAIANIGQQEQQAQQAQQQSQTTNQH